MKQAAFLLLALSIVFSCKKTKNESDIDSTPLSLNEMIAFAHGSERWSQVKEIRFTFNVDRDTTHLERSWIWKPKTNNISLIQNGDSLNYNRNKIDSTLLQADASFINDKFWLLAPFNLSWDQGTSFSKIDSSKAPISQKTMQQLTVTYEGEGGYTPGDAYDFFFGNDFMIKEWVYRKNNDSNPTLITTWEEYKDFNGIKIATMHQNPERTFKLYFTNIEVIITNE